MSPPRLIPPVPVYSLLLDRRILAAFRFIASFFSCRSDSSAAQNPRRVPALEAGILGPRGLDCLYACKRLLPLDFANTALKAFGSFVSG